ncbi:hypothetical protein [uncultured Gemella sp.]|uniref:hypothetical protein n=1 Tax=uncultured Gemella sp. TaxID=254352 RepID=UPI00260B1741|nr:hypothetical protein [uncultured Gemella sp.]
MSLHKILFVLLKLFKVRGFVTYLAHLKQIGVFDKISGLLIGIFTKIEKKSLKRNYLNLFKRIFHLL